MGVFVMKKLSPGDQIHQFLRLKNKQINISNNYKIQRVNKIVPRAADW